MKNVVKNMSFRSKILFVLLFITLLLSSFSLILTQSINDINEVSTEVKETNIPELVWLSHWEEELKVKEYMVETAISNDFCCEFVTTYNSYGISSHEDTIKNEYGTVPDSLKDYQREIDLLDFKVTNNVAGLIEMNDHEAAADYIVDQYLPDIIDLQSSLADERLEVFHTLDDHTDQFSSIIEKSLVLLIFLTALAIILSFIFAYRISNKLTHPVENMVEKVGDIADGQYGLSIPEAEQLELQLLTTSINKMSSRLKESFNTILNDKIYREQILNSLPIGIMTIGTETSDFTLNNTAKKMLGNAPDSVKEKIRHPDKSENEDFWNIVASKSIVQNVKVSFETEESKQSLLVSQSELMDQTNEVIGRIFYFVDITETEELEKKMHQTEKLALVGELAAGAAHEIRNPLAVIDGFLELMKQSLSESEQEKYYLPLLMKELDRINSIIEEMLLLTKPSAPVTKEAYLEDLIDDILPLITQAIGSEEVEFDIQFDCVPLFIDVKQMKQVFHNLIRNSVEAMDGEGTISVHTKVNQKNYDIYFHDTGPGVPKKIQQSLFEPFLTSKEAGTGLGLTIVQRIIANHCGKIELLSTSHEGTTFKISLPLNDER
ncbi:sensor histidine kinase [Evansella halocellulosilytica]|uniref:sensor histidine kinase n=1 Tax=Evansella halocellulosilytica TaxID=2011013 RepID=UPI000BB940A7|nr:ATP-binding protein [Evansella halocellulosilytica]